ncbi:MAG: hypothetical protein Q8K13_20490 [Parvibaculum sp.]|uniref:hypothetical protein n=1 Tax=Parvibaculum sp. TaxID=2024848 RepID=UPI0027305599|nr:hypothetical protein [Parvibaculum sp.]MDP2152016.1 hypothetical protein [Parvibaculum sp.]
MTRQTVRLKKSLNNNDCTAMVLRQLALRFEVIEALLAQQGRWQRRRAANCGTRSSAAQRAWECGGRPDRRTDLTRYESNRDLAADLLQAVREMKAGKQVPAKLEVNCRGQSHLVIHKSPR